MAKLNANPDDTWSVSASDEDELHDFINGLNNCLAHPELDTPEKIEEWMAAQAEDEDEEDEE